MNYADWYTDLMDVYRVKPTKEGNLTKNERVQVGTKIPCRVYRSGVHGPKMKPDAADSQSEDKLACANEEDIQAGDELMIHRGAVLRKARQTMRAFAGEPAYFYEPFGAVLPGLAHQEVGLLQQEYIKGGVEDGAG